MTAGNSTPLSDGAVGRAAGQRRVGRASARCRCSRTSPTSETAAVDYVHGDEGLLMAPVYACRGCSTRRG